MRFLANENFPLPSVRLLRRSGHDVAAIIEDSPGEKDHNVLTRATSEGRIVLTFDRDYGELIYRLKMPKPTGVIYFRYDPITPEEPAQHLFQLFGMSSLSLSGKFTVVERGQIRQRPLH